MCANISKFLYLSTRCLKISGVPSLSSPSNEKTYVNSIYRLGYAKVSVWGGCCFLFSSISCKQQQRKNKEENFFHLHKNLMNFFCCFSPSNLGCAVHANSNGTPHQSHYHLPNFGSNFYYAICNAPNTCTTSRFIFEYSRLTRDCNYK